MDVDSISRFIQAQLNSKGMDSVGAIEAARWLDQAGLLCDSELRSGLPLRGLLRAAKITGQRQEPNGRWYIDRVAMDPASTERPEPNPTVASREHSRSRQLKRGQAETEQRDEAYVINLCDEILGHTALRQHRFDFLVGDAGTRLPVDAYYPALPLVVEYREPQHTKPIPFFDKPHRLTVSGVNRGEQRALYDQRRRDVLPRHGIGLLEISYEELSHTTRGRLTRDRSSDIRVLCRKMAEYLVRTK